MTDQRKKLIEVLANSSLKDLCFGDKELEVAVELYKILLKNKGMPDAATTPNANNVHAAAATDPLI